MKSKQEKQEQFRQRVLAAAEAALGDHRYVSAIDVLTGARLLEPSHVLAWKKGRIDFLESALQANPQKLSLAFSLFRDWAAERKLNPGEIKYTSSGREGTVELRFSQSGDPEIEKIYRTHYVSPALPEVRQQKIADKLSRPEPPAVFEITRESACSDCGVAIERDGLLRMDAGQPLCLACAGLDDLEFLPAGDTALTRRSTKYSSRIAVVVRFSRSRGRYERQGILVEKEAIEKAEQECSADAEERARERAAGAKQRVEEDRKLVERMIGEIRTLFPGCPVPEVAAIAAHTAARGSGRVGRSAAGRTLDEQALTLAVVAAVRHRHTNYDELLASGVDRAMARERVRERIDEILDRWRPPA